MSWKRAVLSILIIFLGGCSLINQNPVKNESSRVVCKVTFIQIGENTRLIYEFDGLTVSFTRINDGATRVVTTVKEFGGEERDIKELVKRTTTEVDFTKLSEIYNLVGKCKGDIHYF